MTLFEKIADSLHHGFDMAPEQLAVLSHGVPREDGHHLRDVEHQRGGGGVGCFVNIPQNKGCRSPECSVDRQAAWTCRGHEHAPCGMSMSMGMQHEHGHENEAWK